MAQPAALQRNAHQWHLSLLTKNPASERNEEAINHEKLIYYCMFSAPAARNAASSTTQRAPVAPFAADREPGFMVKRSVHRPPPRAPQPSGPSSTTQRPQVAPFAADQEPGFRAKRRGEHKVFKFIFPILQLSKPQAVQQHNVPQRHHLQQIENQDSWSNVLLANNPHVHKKPAAQQLAQHLSQLIKNPVSERNEEVSNYEKLNLLHVFSPISQKYRKQHNATATSCTIRC